VFCYVYFCGLAKKIILILDEDKDEKDREVEEIENKRRMTRLNYCIVLYQSHYRPEQAQRVPAG
jgi:hypothetical protein